MIVLKLTEAEAEAVLGLAFNRARQTAYDAKKATRHANDYATAGKNGDAAHCANTAGRLRKSHKIAAAIVGKVERALDPPVSPEDAATIEREQAAAEEMAGTS